MVTNSRRFGNDGLSGFRLGLMATVRRGAATGHADQIAVSTADEVRHAVIAEEPKSAADAEERPASSPDLQEVAAPSTAAAPTRNPRHRVGRWHRDGGHSYSQLLVTH